MYIRCNKIEIFFIAYNSYVCVNFRCCWNFCLLKTVPAAFYYWIFIRTKKIWNNQMNCNLIERWLEWSILPCNASFVELDHFLWIAFLDGFDRHPFRFVGWFEQDQKFDVAIDSLHILNAFNIAVLRESRNLWLKRPVDRILHFPIVETILVHVCRFAFDLLVEKKIFLLEILRAAAKSSIKWAWTICQTWNKCQCFIGLDKIILQRIRLISRRYRNKTITSNSNNAIILSVLCAQYDLLNYSEWKKKNKLNKRKGEWREEPFKSLK